MNFNKPPAPPQKGSEQPKPGLAGKEIEKPKSATTEKEIEKPKPAPTEKEIEQSRASVKSYIEAYTKIFPTFQLAAKEIEQMIRTGLSVKGMPCIVSSRAKDPGRLRDKLNGRIADPQNPKMYPTTDDIEKDIVDIVGTRVVLYLSHDAKEASNEISKILVENKTWDFKGITDKVLTSAKLLTMLSEEKVMKSLDLDNPKEYTPQEDQYQARLGSYRANHLRLTLSPQAFSADLQKQLSKRDVKVEIQIQGLLMHAWSEISHDVLYKPLSGKLSKEEYELLDCLNGIGKLGESVLLKLSKLTKARVEGAMQPALLSSGAKYLPKAIPVSDKVVDDVYVIEKEKDGTNVVRMEKREVTAAGLDDLYTKKIMLFKHFDWSVD